jgi:hypothetical protein
MNRVFRSFQPSTGLQNQWQEHMNKWSFVPNNGLQNVKLISDYQSFFLFMIPIFFFTALFASLFSSSSITMTPSC